MIQYGENKYKVALRKMWKLCFPNDSEQFITFYFKNVYRNNETLICIEEGRPVASMQIIPYAIRTNYAILKSSYLSGVMTHPDFRRRGYMNQLMNAAFKEMHKQGCAYAFLIPQEEWLINVYSKYGFQCLTSNITSQRGGWQIPANIVLKTKEQFHLILEEFFNEGGVLFINKEGGMAFAIQINGKVILKEFLYPDEATRDAYLQKIRQYYKTNVIIFPNESKGMIKRLHLTTEKIETLYMGMMMD